MTTTAVIALGILVWILVAILVALVLARVCGQHRLQGCSAELPPTPPTGKPVGEKKPVSARLTEAMSWRPAVPARFVGRADTLAAGSAALAPGSGRTAVVFHGMAGAGKTTCAVQLAHRHQGDFTAVLFWSAPADPDQSSDALRLLALQLGNRGLAMVDNIATREHLERFRPTLSAVFADAGVLLILDNLESLLTADGQWRDHRWGPAIGAFTRHQGRSRVILASRLVPAGLDPDVVLIRSVPVLSRDESSRLVHELPTLRALLHTVPLGRCLLTLTQGNPQLLDFADAAAADPARLVYQLAEIEAAVSSTELAGFLTQGHTRLDAEQLRQLFTTWISTLVATAPASARLLLQTLCRMDEIDRNTAVTSANWPGLWRRLDQPGRPPSLASTFATLVSAALIARDPIDDSADPEAPARYRIHPGVVEAVHDGTPKAVIAAVDAQLATWWTAVVDGAGFDAQPSGADTSQVRLRASLAAARYLLRQRDWNAASCILERALIHDGYCPATSLAVIPELRRIAEATGALKDVVVLGAAVRRVDPGEAEPLLRHAYDQATTDGEYELASTTAGELVTLLRDQGRLREALTIAGQKIEHTRRAGFGHWTHLSDHGRQLQILNLLGRHEQVLGELPGLRAQMAALPDQSAHNDRVNPWNVREGVLDIGRMSAVALERWDDALDLNEEIIRTKGRRGAGVHEIVRARLNDYLPLLRLGRLAEADRLLRDCSDTADLAADDSHQQSDRDD